jgi:hypothetical protein
MGMQGFCCYSFCEQDFIPIFTAALFTITKRWKPRYLSVNEWVQNVWHICQQNTIQPQKECNPVICSNVDG